MSVSGRRLGSGAVALVTWFAPLFDRTPRGEGEADPPGADGSPAFPRPWAPWALALVALIVGFMIWHPFPPGIWNDDGVYVLLGRSLARGDGLRYVGLPGAPLAPKFPPLFPLLLGAVWVFFPTFPRNVPALGAVNPVLMALAAGVFSLYLRKILRFPVAVALSAPAVVWLSAHLWQVSAVPLSEPLFLLCLLLALWAGGRMESDGGTGRATLFLLAGGLAFYTRTLGVAVLAAGVGSLLLAGRRRRALWVGLGGVGLVLPWWVWSHGAAASIPSYLLDTLGPYTGWLGSQVRQDPLQFGGFLLANGGQLLARILGLLLPGVANPPLFLGLATVPLLALGMWVSSRRSKLLPLTLLFSLGILLVWPFQDIRLLVPFQPLLMLMVGMGFWALWRARRWPRAIRASIALAGVVWLLFFAGASVYRLTRGWPVEPYRIRSAALLDAVRAVTEKTPPDAVVGAPELWAGLQLYTGRTVVPSARFHPLSRVGPVEGTPEEQYEIWIGSGLTYLLVEHGGRVHGAAVDRIDALCPPGTVEVVDSQPGRFLVALHWDEACQDRVLRGGGGGGRPDD